jgi:hypothetical protein
VCACCRCRRQPKDPVGRRRGRRASRSASLDSQGHRYSKPPARRTGQRRSRIFSRRDLSGPEGEGNYPLRGHGAAPTSPPGGVLRLMPSTSTRDACLTSSGLPWADSGRPDCILRHRRLRMVCLRLYLYCAQPLHRGVTRLLSQDHEGPSSNHMVHHPTLAAEPASPRPPD